MASKGKIALVGSGLIGRSWAMLFISAGYKVQIYDIDPNQVKLAAEEICSQVTSLEQTGNLRGSTSAKEQIALVSTASSLEECLKDAIYVQESVSERLELKEKVFKQLDWYCTDTMVLASSTGTFPASTFTAGMRHKDRVLIAHPVNPPYYMPLVELCPSPWTDSAVVESAYKIITDIGQTPVVIKKEIKGFVQPRIQHAMTQECMRLVTDGVMSVEDVDKVMSAGLGRRYTFMGPFETAHLNAEGFKGYRDVYADMIYNITSDQGPAVTLNPDSPQVKEITRQLCERVPLDQIKERQAWRDSRLATLYRMRAHMDDQFSVSHS